MVRPNLQEPIPYLSSSRISIVALGPKPESLCFRRAIQKLKPYGIADKGLGTIARVALLIRSFLGKQWRFIFDAAGD